MSAPRWQSGLQALILGGLGLFLLEKIWSGGLFWYINPRFTWLVLLAGLGLLLLAQLRLAKLSAQPGHDHDHAHDDEDEFGVSPAHAHGGLGRWGWLLLALPLGLGLLIPPRSLGAAALANRGLSQSAPLAETGRSAVELLAIPAETRSLLDWVQLAALAPGSLRSGAETADLIGFVAHPPGLPADQFLLARFGLTCCVADAFASGMLVTWEGAADLPEDGWVRVRGSVETGGAFDGQPVLVIRAEFVQPVSAPAEPYLIP